MLGPARLGWFAFGFRAVGAALFGVLACAWPAAAFHDSGVASCKSCHVMHESDAGAMTAVSTDGALIRGATASELCLTCHATTLGSVLGLDPLAPPPERGAGNFVFLLEDNLNDGPAGATAPIVGDEAGHNIDAPGYGLFPDARYSSAPGGTFPSSGMGCTACHDPHGNGAFRMLNGVGPVTGGSAYFSFAAFQAGGIDLASSEAATNHTAYLDGVSDWCGNCHGAGYDHSGGSSFDHDGEHSLGGSIRDRYNTYNGESDPTGGTLATAYLPAVPFENPFGSISDTSGPVSGAGGRLMCLSCHRAHASSAPQAGRWDFNVTLLSADGVASGSWPIPDPYNDPAQVGLCAKCHDDETNPSIQGQQGSVILQQNP